MTRETSVQMLKEMGFSETQARDALNASNDDVNKAIEFLFGDVDDAPGSGTEQSPIHVEEVSVHESDSVAISNPQEIPDLSVLSQDHTHAKTKRPSGSISENMEDMEFREDVHEGSASPDEAESSESDDKPFPPSEKTEEHIFPVILNKEKALRSWVPVLSILANFAPFAKALDESKSGDPLVSELRKLVGHFSSFSDSSSWYVTTQGLAEHLSENFPVGDYSDDEMLLSMLTSLASLDPALKQLFESKVESIEDDLHKELIVLEIESESRSATLYETLNGLFWQKDYELLGQIKYSHVAPLVVYQLEHSENTKCVPFQLPEIIYPEIYSDKALEQVKEEIHAMALAERNYHEISRKLMDLNFFQGMKIDSLLQKATSVIETESKESANDLKKLIAALDEQKAKAVEKQTAHKVDASPERLHSFESLVKKIPDLQPYSLLGVILSSTHYFMNYNGTWVNMATQTVNDFCSVQHHVQEASSVGPHLITLLYQSNVYAAQESNL